MKGLREIMAELAAAGPPAPPDVFRCAGCEDTGFVSVTDSEGNRRSRRCECAERELEAARGAAMVAWCELPEPMRAQTFAAFDLRKGERDVRGLAEALGACRAYAQGAAEAIEKPPLAPLTPGVSEAPLPVLAHPWLWLDGPRGTGKTHLAVAVLNYRLEHPGLPLGKFVHVEDWLDHLREGMADNSYAERFHLFCEAPLLVLDDLGAHQGTSWAVAKVDQLVDYRYRNRAPTIFTTNPAAQLPERAADRMADRQLCRKFELRGASYRRRP